MNELINILDFHFSKYLIDDLKLSFYPYFIGKEICKPEKDITWHNHPDQYTFHYILNGSGYLLINGEKIKLKADDVFFVAPDSNKKKNSIGYYPDSNDPWEYVWFNLVGEGVENLLSASKLTRENCYYTVQYPNILRQQLIEMITIAEKTTKRNASYFLPFVMKFFAVLTDERNLWRLPQSNKAKKVKIILDYIEKNYANPAFSINEIAAQMFYSNSYVSRIFKESTGMSPIEYTTSLRMMKAMDYLRSGNYNITQVSYLVGYNSPFYFSKEFKKYFGQTPSEFRR